MLQLQSNLLGVFNSGGGDRWNHIFVDSTTRKHTGFQLGDSLFSQGTAFPSLFFGDFRRQGQILDPDRPWHFDFILKLILYALPPILFKMFLESSPV